MHRRHCHFVCCSCFGDALATGILAKSSHCTFWIVLPSGVSFQWSCWQMLDLLDARKRLKELYGSFEFHARGMMGKSYRHTPRALLAEAACNMVLPLTPDQVSKQTHARGAHLPTGPCVRLFHNFVDHFAQQVWKAPQPEPILPEADQLYYGRT